jgi:response regulator RpfG family c-di-GMP phosphodiesterase
MFQPAYDNTLGPLEAPVPASVLVVDDEVGVRDLLSRWLASGGYDVKTAANADEALSRLHETRPAVALCDIRMPGHDGLWLAQQIRQQAPETAIIMATGVHDVGSAVASLRHGVVDYLTKPFGRDRLREAVYRGLEWHRTARDSRRWRESLEQELDRRRCRLTEAISSLRIEDETTLDGMLAALSLNDRDFYAHAYRVAALSVSLGRALGMTDAQTAFLERAALLHDLGKLAIPEAVLRKPAPLTLEELTLVRLHPSVAAEILRTVPFLADAADLVRDAQERMDGLGYPRGIRAGDAPLGSRIIAVVDAFDAMTRPRVFRDAISAREAFLELSRCAGTQFDPGVVEAFRGIGELANS